MGIFVYLKIKIGKRIITIIIFSPRVFWYLSGSSDEEGNRHVVIVLKGYLIYRTKIPLELSHARIFIAFIWLGYDKRQRHLDQAH